MLVFYRKDFNGGKNEITPIEWLGIRSSSTHAEMKAIALYLSSTHQNRGRRKRHKKHIFRGKVPRTMFVVSMYKNIWRNSRPCDDCIKILRYYGVKKVIYTTGLTDPNKFFCVEEVSKMEFLGRSRGNCR